MSTYGFLRIIRVYLSSIPVVRAKTAKNNFGVITGAEITEGKFIGQPR